MKKQKLSKIKKDRKSIRKKTKSVLSKDFDYKIRIKNSKISFTKLVSVPIIKRKNQFVKRKIRTKSDDELYSYYKDIPYWLRAVCEKSNEYDQNSIDIRPVLEIYRKYIQWHNSYNWPIRYEANDYNRNIRSKIENWWAEIDACYLYANNIVFENYKREVEKLKTIKTKIVNARKSFENKPSKKNTLGAIQSAYNELVVQANLIGGFVLIDTDRTRNLDEEAVKAFTEGAQLAATDDIDRCRQEYITYNSKVVPARKEFTNDPAKLKLLNSGHYQIAIITDRLIKGVKTIEKEIGKIVINSGYRNPKKQISPPIKGGPNSRHCYGDAVDIDSAKNTKTWEKIAKVSCKAKAVWVEPLEQSTNNHVHADWRPSHLPHSSTYCKKIKP